MRRKVAALAWNFRGQKFEYANNAPWGGGPEALGQFLRETRHGDCTYFATATTLLLRACGVPARLVVGFQGGEWDPRSFEVVVRNQTAHAWTEVHVAGSGWHPVDATLWVRPDPGSVLPGVTPGHVALPPDEDSSFAAGDDRPEGTIDDPGSAAVQRLRARPFTGRIPLGDDDADGVQAALV